MSSYSEGQTHQLMNALEAANFSATELTLLGQFPRLIDIKAVLHGTAKIVITVHTIVRAAAPFVPKNWKVEEHQLGSQLQWDPDRVSLFLCEEQKGGSIEGRKLRQKLQGEPVLNANILDYLLANPQLIPEEWKGKAVFFWGTIYRYRHSYGHLFVRYLYWDGEQWLWDYRWLDFDFLGGHPAALLRK